MVKIIQGENEIIFFPLGYSVHQLSGEERFSKKKNDHAINAISWLHYIGNINHIRLMTFVYV